MGRTVQPAPPKTVGGYGGLMKRLEVDVLTNLCRELRITSLDHAASIGPLASLLRDVLAVKSAIHARAFKAMNFGQCRILHCPKGRAK